MHSYNEIALINSVVVVPLALVAGITGRLLKRPTVTHILWVLVLLKLITPPVWQIPMIDREWLVAKGKQVLPEIVNEIERIDRIDLRRGFPNAGNVKSDRLKSRPKTLANLDQRYAANQASFGTIVINTLRSENFRHLVCTGMLLVWSLGAIAWFGVQGFRCARFRWTLLRGTPAGPELQRFSDRMARRLGLSHSPVVWLMPGVLSPMLWGNGQSALLIFPEQLLDRLDQDATGTLLTHELAHFRRRDHWVRIIALLATGFFWWHPVVWWARREIEAVEEECCDALVVKAATAPPKRYAEAILDAVDFLAEWNLRLPPLATGLGQVPFLRQRLTWIMRGPRQQNLGYCGKCLCLLLACTLPIHPSWLAARPSPQPSINQPTLRPPSTSAEVESLASQTQATVPEAVASPLLAVQAATLTSGTLATRPLPQGFEVRSYSSDGRFAVLGNQVTLELLDLETGKEFELNDFVIHAMAFAPETHRFVTISRDGIMRLWNAETCEVVRAWNVPGGSSKSVDISRNGDMIVTGGRDGIVRLWTMSSLRPLKELPRELAPINCVRFSPDGQFLAVATGDWMSQLNGRIALIEASSGAEKISMNWNSPTAAVAFQANGESLMSGDWQGRVAQWNLATGELWGLSEGHKDLMSLAEFSPNGSPLADIKVEELKPNSLWNESEVSIDSNHWTFGRFPSQSVEKPKNGFRNEHR